MDVGAAGASGQERAGGIDVNEEPLQAWGGGGRTCEVGKGPFVTHLECVKCGRRFEPVPDAGTCPECGPSGVLDVVYDYEAIRARVSRSVLSARREMSMWRYMEFMPVAPGAPRPGLRVGYSPLYRAATLAEALGMERLWVKDDGVNPTASLKDRASAVAVAKALEAKASTIACSSTGNAASSLAGSAASVGLRACIFVPERAPAGKVAQLLIFGATVVMVQGSYRDAFELSAEAIERFGWYNRNAAINPYMVEGKKTVAFEIAEQLGFASPDWVAVSVGDGCTIAGVYKGFRDFWEAGLIDRIPRILGVQAEGCNPISKAFRAGTETIEPQAENTFADSIAVGVPRNPIKALRAVRASGGTMVDVSDDEIRDAMRLLGRTCGVFGEPAGVTGLAGLAKAIREGIIGAGESCVVIVTGNGLKDVASATAAAGKPISVPKDIGLLVEELERRGFELEG